MNHYARINRGRDYDGSYRSNEEHRTYVRERRRECRRRGVCINGRPDGLPSRSGRVHGPVVPGTGKCADCVEAAHRSRP